MVGKRKTHPIEVRKQARVFGEDFLFEGGEGRRGGG